MASAAAQKSKELRARREERRIGGHDQLRQALAGMTDAEAEAGVGLIRMERSVTESEAPPVTLMEAERERLAAIAERDREAQAKLLAAQDARLAATKTKKVPKGKKVKTKALKCPDCGLKAKNWKGLARHLQLTHKLDSIAREKVRRKLVLGETVNEMELELLDDVGSETDQPIPE